MLYNSTELQHTKLLVTEHIKDKHI